VFSGSVALFSKIKQKLKNVDEAERKLKNVCGPGKKTTEATNT
jgi:hypothetical protein